MAYVVRDRRSLRQLLVGGALSVVVVVGLCAFTGHWWIAAVGLPMSALGLRQQIERQAIQLRADDESLSLNGESVPWSDIDEVAVAPGRVQVTLDLMASPAPGTQGVVTRPGDPTTRQVWTGSVGGDPETHLSRISAVAPTRVTLTRST